MRLLEVAEPIDYKDVIEDLIWRFAYRYNDANRQWLTAGGLSAIEYAFEALSWDNLQ